MATGFSLYMIWNLECSLIIYIFRISGSISESLVPTKIKISIDLITVQKT
jgi:hypothetical protein